MLTMLNDILTALGDIRIESTDVGVGITSRSAGGRARASVKLPFAGRRLPSLSPGQGIRRAMRPSHVQGAACHYYPREPYIRARWLHFKQQAAPTPSLSQYFPGGALRSLWFVI
jgi:hypothetical protein